MPAPPAPRVIPLPVVAAFAATAVSVLVAVATMLVHISMCGESPDPCSRTSSASIAVYFSWAGIVAVVALTVVLVTLASRRAWTAPLTVAAAAYVGWLLAMVATLADR